MAVEIERKFLVDAEKWAQLIKPEPTHLKQGYLVNDELKTIRVRIAGEKAYLTIKGRTVGISRSEYEYPLPVKDAIELLDTLAISFIEKNRYCINFAGHTWEVDVFLGDNTGLIAAEIELETAATEFELPDWITIEVSADTRYYNSNLSVKPYNKWI